MAVDKEIIVADMDTLIKLTPGQMWRMEVKATQPQYRIHPSVFFIEQSKDEPLAQPIHIIGDYVQTERGQLDCPRCGASSRIELLSDYNGKVDRYCYECGNCYQVDKETGILLKTL